MALAFLLVEWLAFYMDVGGLVYEHYSELHWRILCAASYQKIACATLLPQIPFNKTEFLVIIPYCSGGCSFYLRLCHTLKVVMRWCTIQVSQTFRTRNIFSWTLFLTLDNDNWQSEGKTTGFAVLCIVDHTQRLPMHWSEDSFCDFDCDYILCTSYLCWLTLYITHLDCRVCMIYHYKYIFRFIRVW